MKILSEVLHVKSPSPLVKDYVLYILYLLSMYSGLWECDVVERGNEGVHSKFYYEGLGVKKGHG